MLGLSHDSSFLYTRYIPIDMLLYLSKTSTSQVSVVLTSNPRRRHDAAQARAAF